MYGGSRKEEHGHYHRHGDEPKDDHAHRESEITVECLSKTMMPSLLGPPSQSRQHYAPRSASTPLIQIKSEWRGAHEGGDHAGLAADS